MLRQTIELTVSFFVVAVLAWALWETRTWPPQSQIFPWSIGIPVLGLALIQLASAARNMLESKARAVSDTVQSFTTSAEANPSRQNTSHRRVFIMQLWIIIFFAGVWLLGFKVGAVILTFAFLKIAAREPWKISASFAFVSYLFFLVLFDFALKVPLGAGVVAEFLELNSLDMYLVEPFLNLLSRVMESFS